MKLFVLLSLCAAFGQSQGRETPGTESPEVFRGAVYGPRPVDVTGAVRTPLTFQASGTTTLLDAIARAGGLTAAAGSEILVRVPHNGPGGPGPIVRRVYVQALIDLTDPEVNLRLTGGEEVHVPQVGKVSIVGNVTRPGAFPVPFGETSVLQMLAHARGLEPFAGKQAYIYRREAAGRKREIPVDLFKIMQGRAPDVTLRANDVLYVPDARYHRLGLTTLEKLVLFGHTPGASAASYGAW